MKNHLHILIYILCAVLLCGCTEVLPEPDPHAGMVEVFNGYSNVWIVPDEEVPVNTLTAADFKIKTDGGVKYVGDQFRNAIYGIDVSSHQRDIDWQQVADSGIGFAILRIGGRYYGGDGELYTDDLFTQNLQGAADADLAVGVYFFSAAMNADEARAEAQFVLQQLGGAKLSLPVFFDWERIGGGLGRADDIPWDTLTECAKAFCETIRQGGYEAGVYFNLDTAYYGFDMSELTGYTLWCAAPGEYPYCYYAHTLWQYSFEGAVPGIDAPCDLDMMFVG